MRIIINGKKLYKDIQNKILIYEHFCDIIQKKFNISENFRKEIYIKPILTNV